MSGLGWGALLLAGLGVTVFGVTIWRGRRLARFADDVALLAERVQRHREVHAYIGGIAALVAGLGCIFFVERRQAVYALPMIVVAVFGMGWATALGDVPLMRALQRDDAPLRSVLMDMLRYFVAFWAFTMVLLIWPYVVHATDTRAAIVGFAGLVVWAMTGSVGRILGAQPLPKGSLRDRLTDVEAQAHCEPPRCGDFGRASGGSANALAIPIGSRRSVLFTRRLLASLEVEETAALYAHELAHLEEGGAVSARRMWVLSSVAVILATFGVSLAEWLRPGWGRLFVVAWPLFAGALVLPLLLGSKHRESVCDRRAVEMCGDGTALARALVRVHELNFLPRRMASAAERSSTHPSLARRLRDIGEASGQAAPEPSPFELVLESEGARVALRESRMCWRGVGVDWDRGYEDVVELRVRIRGGRPVLRAVPKEGEACELDVPTASASALQAALDRVDARLGYR